MIRINDNFQLLPPTYLFSEVALRLSEFRKKNPEVNVIRMDIGDVTLPLSKVVTDAMHEAIDEMSRKETFRGYGPERGYDFLREAISGSDYVARGVSISPDEIFISDGAKSDLANLGDIFSSDTIIALADPGYPVYEDTAVLGGRGGSLEEGRWNRIIYLECGEEYGFIPQLPKSRPDVIFLCSPSNPTGVALNRNQLKKWVDYARDNGVLIVYDSAYEAYISDSDVPKSIYEIEGADEVAIEVRSFSKTAGFTGVRCGYTVVPHKVKGIGVNGVEELNKLWNRRQSTKFNGASFISQKAAAALYTAEGRKAIRENVEYYMQNARLIKKSMEEAGFKVWGGENSPYVWAKAPVEMDSWEIFGRVLEKCDFSSTPGVGFGKSGAGFIRLTGFNTHENTRTAMDRLLELGIKGLFE